MPFWLLLQKYWKEILFGIVLIVISAFWYIDRASLIRAMDAATQRHQEELTIIKKSHEREERRKQALIEEYEQVLELLERDFERREQEIERLREKRIDELAKLRMTDPQALARKIEEQFGFSYVE